MKKNLNRDCRKPTYRKEAFGSQRKQIDALYDEEGVGPARLSMRMEKQRPFSDKHSRWNTSMLLAWLSKQVGKPWSQVRADVKRAFPRKKDWVVRDWLLREIETHTFTDGQHLRFHSSYGYDGAARDISSADFYVHPETGVLSKSETSIYSEWRANRLVRKAEAVKEQAARLVILDERHRLVKLAGIWYQLNLTAAPPNMPLIFDACGLAYPFERDQVYGSRGLYCKQKKQLSTKELKQFHLLAA